MRKYLIVAIVATTAMAFAATSFGATPAATMKVSVTPKKAGTKKKPKNSGIHLTIKNNDSKRTLSKLTITTPKTFKFSGKGLTTCKEADLVAGGPPPARRLRSSARAPRTPSSASTAPALRRCTSM